MPARSGTAHVVTTIRKYKDRVYRTHLLRRSYREGGTVKNETLGNLSHLPEPLIEIIRRSLQGETFVPVAQAFEITRSRPHGHVQAVATAMQRLGLASLIASQPCREREQVLAMSASRIVAPHTKLATTRWWHTTTLADDFGVADADEDDLYAAMDWLLERQDRVQKKLAARHLSEGSLVLYDLSSSYFEGTTCPLAKLGHDRDGKKGLLQVNYGLLTDVRGCPVAVSVYEGNVTDSKTLVPEVKRVREDFGIEQLVMVGDRGMISSKAIAELRETDGVGWITALKSVSIRALIEQGHLQLGLFDERNLVELSSPDFPGERLVACRNPELARLRTHKREELLAATERNLAKIKARVDAGKLVLGEDIGLRVGKVVNQYKVAKHFELAIGDKSFTYARKSEAIAAEAALDGIYIIRHVGGGRADGRARLRARPQGAGQRRARVSLAQDDRPEGAPDPPPHGRSGARAHLPVHARLLRRVAHARGLARADVRRHRSSGQGHARPGGASQALQGRSGQGGPPHAR